MGTGTYRCSADNVDCCNLRMSGRHFKDCSYISCITNAQEKLCLMERVRKGKKKAREWKGRGKKNCLGCKMGPFINNNGSGCIPTGGGDSWNFQISEGPSKAPETGYSVSPDPIREQWSMRPAKKRPERERSYLMLLVTGPAITCGEALPLDCWPHT